MKTITTLTALLAACTLPVGADALNNTEFSYGGYIKLDAIASQYSDGDLSSGNIGRDFYIPALVPVEGVEESTAFDMHARQSRFKLGTKTSLDNGKAITTRIEMDFMATPNGDERISNSYSPRIRIASLQYDNWLFGQSWSTFQDVAVLPETLDFIGATDGTIFVRQAMIRYTNGGFAIAIENPETTITPFGGGGRIIADDNAVPDFVARYTYKGGWGHISLAGLLRQLSYEDTASNIDDSITAVGLSLSAKINIGRDDLKLMINSGSGLGRYLGLNTANGAVLDANGELEAIDATGGLVAYRHWWSEQWRSSLSYSFFNADNDTALTGANATKMTNSLRINALYSPTPALTFGVEYAKATRELESGTDGDMDRLQFSAKYSF
ncbi:hypothetical protein HMF8227_01264 [Saliniradius amylolyticus]|uniref:Porin n=1 Tax=Saliniradius amylolyticus TaxID=2183582 RepID=A0A2S2E2J0_9ALTE|nr:hypothetical protein HMF8227_01264 [Saliniradius amylolyticus]